MTKMMFHMSPSAFHVSSYPSSPNGSICFSTTFVKKLPICVEERTRLAEAWGRAEDMLAHAGVGVGVVDSMVERSCLAVGR